MLCILRLLAVITLACATVVAAEQPAIWIDVPFVKQSPEGCGAASIAMVMRYWTDQANREAGETADATYILKKLHSREGRGIYASQMEKYFRQQGFHTFAFSGTWDHLREHLAKGRPLIVALKPTGTSGALHYVVVAGIDNQQGIVTFNDPAGRKLTKLDRKSFESDWKPTAQWTLLAIPDSGAR